MSSLKSKGRTASFSSITDAFPLLRAEPERDTLQDNEKRERLWSLMSSYIPSDVPSIQKSIANHVEYTLASSRFNFDTFKAYLATAHSIRDRLIESWNDTNQYFDQLQVKRVAYLSLEFLMGRSMANALLNMDLEKNYRTALKELGFTLEDLYEKEHDAALGNGGLGRLAACFLDSMATLNLPAWGYGIRYNYGIFRQIIRDGAQVEVPDYWLTFGNPWEIQRLDVVVPVRFYGHCVDVDCENADMSGKYGKKRGWHGGEIIMACAYDNPIPGFDTYNTINLRLWKALPAKEFDFESFNSGDYLKAVEARQRAENISNVLYPSDSTYSGKELRLKQQYLFVAATLHDIVRRFKRLCGSAWDLFHEKNAVQLNDTHPAIAIAELMRILVDKEELPWDFAWNITKKTFGYTNHTILPEALEKWSVDLFSSLLPRHLEIIYKINWHFLEEVKKVFGDDYERLRRMSIIDEEHGKAVRMAHLAIIGSHAINGVASIHSSLLKSKVFPDFNSMYPNRFQNKTNGVTPRRWINQANPGLASILSKWLDTDEWLKNLSMLSGLVAEVDNPLLHAEWQEVKASNKRKLSAYIQRANGITVNPDALFDIQVKRIHEYKRQQLNALYCIHRYLWIKEMSPKARQQVLPRVIIFGGKAAPGYHMAKLFIKLIHRIADVVNNDENIGDLLKIVFIANYNVSLAEMIIPASDISQHISTAGMEASGTSNMKFAMNGGLIIGTMDGANIEIAEEIGEENMFIFGAEEQEIPHIRHQRRTTVAQPYCPELEQVLESLRSGRFGPWEDVGPILNTLEWANDYYLVTHDFPDYLRAQKVVDETYLDKTEWTRRSILSTAGMGKFSTDRTISEYVKDIWNVIPCPRPPPVLDPSNRSRSFPSLAGLVGDEVSSPGAPSISGKGESTTAAVGGGSKASKRRN